MQYKTIVHELLQQRPHMHEHLRQERKLLPAMELYARELKKNHEAWKQLLSQLSPGSDRTQISSEALEIAVKELEDHLLPVSGPSAPEVLDLDQAMAFLRSRTSRA